MTAPLQFLQEFRQRRLGLFTRRADALFELIDALLLTLAPRSPVELSASPAFRRRFASGYDALGQGQIDHDLARELLAQAEPDDAIQVAGDAVYPLDSTIVPRPDAATLPDRGKVYSASKEGTVPGHQYSWLGRVIAQGQSWFAPRDVERIATHTTPAAVAATQVKRLAATVAARWGAGIVADSHYAKRLFLTVFTEFPNVFVLVRLACNRVLYGPPPVITGPRPKGRPRIHGAKFKLKTPSPPDQQTTVTVGQASVRLSAWYSLHFKDLPALVGMVLRVEFLNPAGQTDVSTPLRAVLEWPAHGAPGSALRDVSVAVWH